MTDTTTLIQRLSDEADLCRNDGATDVAKLLDDAVYALVNQAARLAAAEIVSAQPAAPAEPKGADGLPVSAPRLYADEEPPEPAAHADATEDELLDLEQALERRRILEEIKKVAEVHPADDMPTPFQSAWQQCCEEIFYRATEGQWHMDEDASRFAKNHAAPEPRQPMSACPHGVPHRWSCGECDTGVEMLAPADAAPSVAPEPPEAVLNAAKEFVANGYRGPLNYAKLVFDYVAALHPSPLPDDLESLKSDLISCRGTVKTELHHYERLSLVHGKTPLAANYEAEANRLQALLDRIDALESAQRIGAKT